jgi:hypothetical protein
MKKKVYYNHILQTESQHPFNRKASAVRFGEWYLEAKFNEPTFHFTDNTYCGFTHNKVYEIWDGLPYDMGGLQPFDTYEETTLHPEGLLEAKIRLDSYIQQLNLKNVQDVLWAENDESEFRIIIDNSEFKKGLQDLAEFIGESANDPGKSIEFWL